MRQHKPISCGTDIVQRRQVALGSLDLHSLAGLATGTGLRANIVCRRQLQFMSVP